MTVSPDVLIDKHKRKNVPDIEQPELMLHQSEQFMTNSPLRRLAKEHKKGMFFSDIVEQPTTPAFPRESNHYKSEKSVIAASLWSNGDSQFRLYQDNDEKVDDMPLQQLLATLRL